MKKFYTRFGLLLIAYSFFIPFLMGASHVRGGGCGKVFSESSTLSASISVLVLSVNNTALDAALTGTPRRVTITNTGSEDANGVEAVISGFPAGTTLSSNTCSGTLSPSSSCSVTITPGANASSNCGTGIAPTLGEISVSAENASTVTVTGVVLTYGCIYQGGFLFSVDDTTSDTGSMGGKVVSLVDQAAPALNSGSQASSIIWSSNGTGGASADISYDQIPGIDEESTSLSASPTYSSSQTLFNTTYSNTASFPFPGSALFSSCKGDSDGACNTNNILALYNTYVTNYGIGGAPYALSAGPTNSTFYSAGLCTRTIGGYSDWYLPAICEMDAVDSGITTCPSGIQSMVGSLSFLLGNPGASAPSSSCGPPSNTECLAGYYWSSTEFGGDQQADVWGEDFITGSSSNQTSVAKNYPMGVRCVRALTP